MRSLVEEAGLSDVIEIDSAGTIGIHAGNPPDSRMTAAATARGIPMVGQSRKIRAEDLQAFDWVFVMDEQNLEDVRELAETIEVTANVALFCNFCTKHTDVVVPDPYYGGPEGFEKVLDLLEDGCAGFLASEHVRKTG